MAVGKSDISRWEEYYYGCYAALGVTCSAHGSYPRCRASASPEGRWRLSRWRSWHASGNGLALGSRPGFPHGSFPHYRRFRNYGLGFASWYNFYWDEGEPFEFYPASELSVTSPPVVAPPPVVIVESHDYRPPVPAPEGPKLIEVPQAKGTPITSKPAQPTLFVLANGDRLEARRYMLTTDSLRVEIGRPQRRISLREIDVDATIAANRERGIDLKIPTGKNEIFLGF